MNKPDDMPWGKCNRRVLNRKESEYIVEFADGHNPLADGKGIVTNGRFIEEEEARYILSDRERLRKFETAARMMTTPNEIQKGCDYFKPWRKAAHLMITINQLKILNGYVARTNKMMKVGIFIIFCAPLIVIIICFFMKHL